MKPKVILLVGPPLSGKDTYINSIGALGYKVISRDEIMMSLHENNNYSEAFRTVDQKKVDSILKKEITYSIENKRDIIINMTNLKRKSRKRIMDKFSGTDYEKIAIVFPKLELNEYFRRNEKRNTEENKFIPTKVINSMIESWEDVTTNEGFDNIIKL